MKRIITVVVSLALGAASLSAQNVIDLIISEAVVANETGVVDDYGRRLPWIEVFNTSQGTVNYAGCFITDDLDNLQKYMIPKGDNSTKLGPRQVTIFYFSGDSAEGTRYVGFTVAPGSTVYLVSNDGHTLIDSITIPADLPADMAVAKFATDPKEMDWKLSDEPVTPTPGSKNGSHDAETGSQRMKRNDPYGWILTVTSVSVVFAALLILTFIFTLSGNTFQGKYKRSRKSSPKGAKGTLNHEVAAAIAMALDQDNNGEVYAAISMALDLYLSDTTHDAESFVITIRPTGGTQWNDKTQTFRRLPR